MELQLKTIEYTAVCVALIESNYVFKKHTSVKNPFATYVPSIRYGGRWRLASESEKDNGTVFEVGAV
jgi:hypothetical protein